MNNDANDGYPPPPRSAYKETIYRQREEHEKINSRHRRGPRTGDMEWSNLIAEAKVAVPNDETANLEMVKEWQGNLRHFRGVALDVNATDYAKLSSWKCQIYIGGRQRVIGRGTLYQCARLHDAALLRWAKYRTRTFDIKDPANYNFDYDQVRADQADAEISTHLLRIEEYIRKTGADLTTPEARKVDKRDATAQILSGQEEILRILGSLENRIMELESRLSASATQPATQSISLETLFNGESATQ